MMMLKKELIRYLKLNTIAENGGTVIMGSSQEDKNIPLSELMKAFHLNTMIYNRSAEKLSIKEAVEYYLTVVSPMRPERVILHIGGSDLVFFKEDPAAFDSAYRKLLECIRKDNKHCNIGIVSLQNPQEAAAISEFNKNLRMIAESEQCEFEDISKPRVWNPVEMKSAMEFASAMGLSKKIRNEKSLYDLAKIFFCFPSDCVSEM